MKIIVTYDPGWKKTAQGMVPGWGCLDTVEQVCSFLSMNDCEPELIPADEKLEEKLA
jgi:hypothetical protein